MSTHRHIDRICLAAVIFSLVLSLLFVNGEKLGIKPASAGPGYETRLFDASRVHTIEIVMDDWDGFIEGCENEEYKVCALVIDNEAYKNVGIRAKGNTSLSTVSAMDSDRYSFKIEFDHYDNSKSYYGLDKLSLNNLIQDNTCMKDFISYRLMGEFGVASPLCSYVYISVNGQDWGLYLAVEGVEEAFLRRNYGSDYGSLYKPDSMSFGAGRGNGRNFDMPDSGTGDSGIDIPNPAPDDFASEVPDFSPGGFGSEGFGDGMQPPEWGHGGESPEGNGRPFEEGSGPPDMPRGGFEPPEDFETSGEFSGRLGHGGTLPKVGDMHGGFGGMGSDDVKLKYIDEDPDSYSNIFDNAKTDITDSDRQRLIESLKVLSSGEAAATAVSTDEVIRYFVVHNFLCNGDSYTGSMVHNYYLYEDGGKLSMIPWDYNLAFGGFESGTGAGALVNSPIDSPVSGGSLDDRPMIAWIFENEEYLELYHSCFEQFMEQFFESGELAGLIDATAAMISPYVEKDPSKFCTFEEFEKGAAALKDFCLLRGKSIYGQLDGTIPSTSEGQQADSGSLIDASGINISDMGSMNPGGRADVALPR